MKDAVWFIVLGFGSFLAIMWACVLFTRLDPNQPLLNDHMLFETKPATRSDDRTSTTALITTPVAIGGTDHGSFCIRAPAENTSSVCLGNAAVMVGACMVELAPGHEMGIGIPWAGPMYGVAFWGTQRVRVGETCAETEESP